MNTRIDTMRQRQQMRQRIRAAVFARRMALATAAAESAEVVSAEQPTT